MEIEQRVVQEVMVAQSAPSPVALGTRSLPATVKNHLYLPKVRTQQLNNCGAFSPTYYYKTYQEARERGWLHPDPDTHPERVMSPGFTFPLANGGNNNGANLSTVLWILCRFGAATWKDMPENPVDWWSYPSEEQWRKAIPYRAGQIITFDSRSDAGLSVMKEHLNSGDPLVVSVRLYHDVYNSYPDSFGVDNDVIFRSGLQMWDLHVFTVIGYDDNRAYDDGTGPKSGAFLAVNSWGPYWGVTDPDVGTAGFVWFGYDYIKSAALSESTAYALTDLQAYEPQYLAVIDLQHPQRNELSVGIYAGASATLITVFPNVGEVPFDGRLVVDVSDAATAEPFAFWLSASDVPDNPVARGWITRFEVETPEGHVITSLDTPAQTVDGGAIRLYAGLIGTTDVTFDGGVGEAPGHHQGDEFVGAVADWNLDGLPDLLLGGNRFDYAPAYTRLHLNTGMSFLQEAVAPPFPAANGGAAAWSDINRDGFPDFVLTGYDTSSVYRASLYVNDKLGSFTNLVSGIPGVSYGGVAWGDYDRDGNPDLAICGVDANFQTVIQLWRNTGAGGFSNSGVIFDGAQRGAISWADVNNDGWPDLSIGDKLFRNNGDGTFSDWRVEIPGVWSGAHAWGDFDGDGYLDLAACEAGAMSVYRTLGETLVTGSPSFWVLLLQSVPGPEEGAWPGLGDARVVWADFDNDGHLDLTACGITGQDGEDNVRRTFLWHQEPDGAFRDIGVNVPGLANGMIAWVDVDRDGDLDLLAAGCESDIANRSSAALYPSRIADADGLNRPNRPPAPPDRLSASQPSAAVRLTWDPASDAETPAPALSYEVRVGTAPRLCNIVSPAPGVSLLGAQLRPMLGAGRPGLLLQGLPAGRYYWSVRTIDGGLARSTWCAEQSFTIRAEGVRNGDINGDGNLDVADLIQCRKMINGTLTKNLTTADMNFDGKLDEIDTRILIKMLQGMGAADYTPLKSLTIGPEGGTLASDGFELTVPSGAFGEPMTLQLLASSDDKPFGTVSPETLFMVDGMPVDFVQPLTIRLTGISRTNGALAHLAFGEPSEGTGGHRDPGQMGYRILESVVGPDGVPTFILPATASAKGNSMRSNRANADSTEITWTWVAGGFFEDSVLTVRSPHFKVSRPCDPSFKTAFIPQVSNLVSDLEHAFEKLPEAGFNFAGLRTWPIDVTIIDGTPPSASLGSALCSMLGNNYGYLEFNGRIMNSPELRRTTSAHEFSHVVQSLFDPRNAYSKAKGSPVYYWFDESMATWFEEYGAGTPSKYVSANYAGNRDAAFAGGMIHPTIAADKDDEASHGYGMAVLSKYLSTQITNTVFAAIYNALHSGENILEALATATSDLKGDKWCHAFYNEWLKGTLYEDQTISLFVTCPKSQRFLINGPAQTVQSYQPALPGIGAQVYGVFFDQAYQGLTADDVLAFSLRGTGHERLQLILASGDVDRMTPTNVISGSDLDEKVQRCFLPRVDLISQAEKSVYALLTSCDVESPSFESTVSRKLNMGLAQPIGGTHSIPAFQTCAPNFSINYDPVSFPAYECNGSFFVAADSFGSCTSRVATVETTSHALVRMVTWQDGTINIPVLFSHVLSGVTHEEILPGGARKVYTVTASRGLRVIKKVSPDWTETRRSNVANAFTADLLPNEDGAYFEVNIVYDMRTDDYSPQDALTDTQTLNDMSFTVLSFTLWRL